MIKTAITGSWRFAVYTVFAFLLFQIYYFTERTDFTKLICLYSSAFLLFILMIKYLNTDRLVQEGKWLGIFVRLILLFSMPNLTDDFYRFLWDGQLLLHQHNPYTATPDQVAANHFYGMQDILQQSGLYAALNSRPWHTIYPPLSQGLFATAAWISRGNMVIYMLVLKCSIFIFETGSILLLPKILEQLKMPKKNQLLYTLNPLIILELTGNLHFEASMIFFLLVAFYFLNRSKRDLSAIAFGFAIGSKLWPVMLLPLFFRFIGIRQTLRYCLLCGSTAIILLAPMLMQYGEVASSLNLYFQQFEFNGSVYYLLRWLINKDEHFETFSMMRKLLPVVTLVCIVTLSVFYKRSNFFSALLFAFSIYCLFATTMHPWYLTPLILLASVTSIRYPILWSFLIYLTYITYIDPAYPENYLLVAVEYILVIGFAGYEIMRRIQEAKINGQEKIQ